MPMGVASISLTRPMPGASTARTCSGSLAPRMAASSAGIRLSKISVVLPEPETPVTTVKRPLGMRTSSGLTVWSAAVASRIVPSANICSRATAGRSRSFCAPGPRKGPISERPLAASAGTVPCARMRPPSAPAPGPISTIQSASESTCVSWSTRRTELPSATRSCMTAVSPTMLAGCRPIEGSSSTYSTPVVRLRTARASCMRWRSPVESVAAARSRER